MFVVEVEEMSRDLQKRRWGRPLTVAVAYPSDRFGNELGRHLM